MIIRTWRFFRRWGGLGSISRITSVVFNRIYTRLYAGILGIKVGRRTIIYPGAKLRKAAGGKITLGPRCVIHSGARILAYSGHVTMGENSSLNPFCILYGHGGLDIGDRVLIAAGTVVIPANHRIELGKPIRGQGLTQEGIKIGNDVWLGTGVRIIDGVTIEDGVVVAAGAVVPKGRLTENQIYGGVPARRIGERTKNLYDGGPD